MLFLLWAVGITLGIFAFLAELMIGGKPQHRKGRVARQNDQRHKEPEPKNVLPPIEVE